MGFPDQHSSNSLTLEFRQNSKWSYTQGDYRPGAVVYLHFCKQDIPDNLLFFRLGDQGQWNYTHWTPSKAHVSHLQISSAAAIDAEIAEAQKSLESGAELFIGGHGGAAKTDAVQFKISYLKKMKDVLEDSRTAQDFMDGMKKAYPGLPGEAGLEDLGKALYK